MSKSYHPESAILFLLGELKKHQLTCLGGTGEGLTAYDCYMFLTKWDSLRRIDDEQNSSD